jgi:glucose-1-phosphatase
MKKPELIIFDLGRVLLDFDFMKVVRGLQKHSPHSSQEIRHYFKTTPHWDRFERGVMNEKAFFKSLTTDLKLNGLHYEAFMPLWNDIFEEISGTVAILEKLRKSYRLAMISNVNPMHWKHVQKNHSFMKWFEHPIASYAVGHRKPELEIYHLTLKRAKVNPSEAVFIDDVKAHILAARSIGIRAHHFIDAKRLQKDLKDII